MSETKTMRLAWALLALSCVRLIWVVSTGVFQRAVPRSDQSAAIVVASDAEALYDAAGPVAGARREGRAPAAESPRNSGAQGLARGPVKEAAAAEVPAARTVLSRAAGIGGSAPPRTLLFNLGSVEEYDDEEDDEEETDAPPGNMTVRGGDESDRGQPSPKDPAHGETFVVGDAAAAGADLGEAASPKAQGGTGLSPEVVLSEEAKIEEVWENYFAKHPVVRQYEADWFSHEDLEELTREYWRTRNAVAFGRGLAQSDNFRRVFSKYVSSRTMLDLLKKIVSRMSLRAIRETARLLSSDSALGNFARYLDGQLSGAAGYSPIKHAVPEYGASSIRKAQIAAPKLSSPDWR